MKILIVDDHPVLRQGFAALLRNASDATEVLQAGTVADALRLLDAHPDLDVVVLDLFMPGVGGWEAITTFGRARRDLPIIVLSSSEDPRDVRRALSMGALGYVPKSASPQTLLTAVKLIMDGDLYVPKLLLDEMPTRGPLFADLSADTGDKLTGRQVDVLRLIAAGMPNKAIAAQLELSEKTVKAHVTAIFKALNVVNRTQAVTVGRDSRLI